MFSVCEEWAARVFCLAEDRVGDHHKGMWQQLNEGME